MIENSHTIDDLYSDSGPFDEAEVVRALHPIITIQKSTNSIFYRGGKLSNVQKVLAYALAKKLLKSKDRVKTEMMTAQEFHEKTGIKKGTIDPTFKALKEKGLFVGRREYEIPVHKIQSAIAYLIKKHK